MMQPGLEHWLNTPLGHYAQQWIEARHDSLVSDVFGFNAVQIGLPSLDLLQENRMPFRFSSGPWAGNAVLCATEHLPIASSSVDLVVLPLVLEFSSNPHQVLREVERILVPEGQVIITGINPFSLWGLRRKINALCQLDETPWQGRYISVPRLRDWLSLLGFETQTAAFGCYAPPCRQAKWLRRTRLMELAGKRWWSFAGGTYIVQAIKRQQGMRLIAPRWKDARIRALAPARMSSKSTPSIQQCKPCNEYNGERN